MTPFLMSIIIHGDNDKFRTFDGVFLHILIGDDKFLLVEIFEHSVQSCGWEVVEDETGSVSDEVFMG